MKRRVRLVERFLSLLLVFLAAIARLSAGSLAYSGKSATAFRVADRIVVDGSLGEWNKQSPILVDQKEQVIHDEGQWTGADDCGVKAYVMWDEGSVYLAAEIMDDTPFMYREGFPPDLADSLVLHIGVNPDADPDRAAYEAEDFRLTMVIDDYYFNTGIDRGMVEDKKGYESRGEDGDEQVLDGYECAVAEIDGGYVFECVIPLGNFANDQIPALIPQAGMSVGMEISMFDLDFPCPGVANARIAWSANADIDVNPGLWGSVTFAD
ncbi:MAG: hypothetical protein LBS11_01530 [Oscillospiraceae bacterium]|jgi:hypothetical protein|nr:hypothetical protein [Oscillospiraceae bacterium]